MSQTQPSQTPPSSSAPLRSIGEALALIAAEIRPLSAELVPIGEARGRILAQEITAPLDLPPFPCSAMDGYALRAPDTPGCLPIVGESAAGSPYEGTLGPAQAVAVSTGALIPEGADTVVPLEDLELAPTGEAVVVPDRVPPGAHIRVRGSDLERGQSLLTAPTCLGPAQIGAAAAAGLQELPCARSPRVALLTTGSELRPPGQPLGPGEIYDSNRPMLAAALRSAGAEVLSIPAPADTLEAHSAALRPALAADLLISSGGVSVGPHDHLRAALAELGVREVFWRIAMKPGKPLAFGVFEPPGRQPTLVFGLPGNPVSTLVCFEVFVRPALLALQGVSGLRPAFGSGVLAVGHPRDPRRDELIRARRAEGDRSLTPLTGQQSHQIAVTARADSIVLIPRGSGSVAAGSSVSYLDLGP